MLHSKVANSMVSNLVVSQQTLKCGQIAGQDPGISAAFPIPKSQDLS